MMFPSVRECRAGGAVVVTRSQRARGRARAMPRHKEPDYRVPDRGSKRGNGRHQHPGTLEITMDENKARRVVDALREVGTDAHLAREGVYQFGVLVRLPD